MLKKTRELWLRLTFGLDRFSANVRLYIPDIGSTTVEDQNKITGRSFLYNPWIINLAAVLLVSAVSLTSRFSQYEVMALNLENYFLSDLSNVSTSPDSGYYLSQASDLNSQLTSQSGAPSLQAGQLPGYLVALLSNLTNNSLETSGRLLLYMSVILTSLACYGFFAVQGQALLGLGVSLSIPHFWPVFSRTSIGMVDTDLLNLAFTITILTLIIMASRSGGRLGTILVCAAAGVLSAIYYLWYPKAGFSMVFLITTFMVLYTAKVRIGIIFLSLIAFAIGCGSQQLTASTVSLMQFFSMYITGSAFRGADVVLINELQSELFSAVSEINKTRSVYLENDLGHVPVIYLSLIGILIWIAQDWRRGFSASPLIAFFPLYLFFGPRFGYFAAPLILAGLFVFLFSLLAPLRAYSSRFFKEASPSGKNYIRILRPLDGQVGKIACFMVAFLTLGSASVIRGTDIAPPPVLLPNEVKALRMFVEDNRHSASIVVSWWDYGHEIRYQTKMDIVSDGSNPASIKNIYIGRALISPNPEYSANELRFASYFTEDQLLTHFPSRPSTKDASNLDRDIYVVLPQDLQFKMITIFSLSKKSLNEKDLENYDSRSSLFSRMYHSNEKQIGPFERVLSVEDGLKVYRLKAPQSAK